MRGAAAPCNETSYLQLLRNGIRRPLFGLRWFIHENGLGVKVRNRLQQLGFRVEAGVRCRDGFVLAAHRQDFDQGFGQSLGAIANVA